jgi:hypothetical protein
MTMITAHAEEAGHEGHDHADHGDEAGHDMTMVPLTPTPGKAR